MELYRQVTMNLYGNHTGITASRLDRILRRRLSHVAIAWEPVNVVNTISAGCAAIFILYLTVRVWELRVSRTKTVLAWQGRSKTVSTRCPRLPDLICHTNNDYRFWRFYSPLFYWHRFLPYLGNMGSLPAVLC